MRKLVILDAGHGLDTPGKRTPLFSDDSFMRENEFNRAVIRIIDSMLEEYEEVDVVFTATEKFDVSLTDRVQRANDFYEHYKLRYDKIILISVHANALTGAWGSQNGMGTYYYPTNSVDKEFAEVINRNLHYSIKLKNRGNFGENFMILREVKMTACLVECAFMDNLEEAKLLLTDYFRYACACGIVDGIEEYFGMSNKKIEVDYSVTENGTYQISGSPEMLNVKIVNQKNQTIEEPYSVNGTFFWWEDEARTKSYPTSILVIDGKIIQDAADHYNRFGCPQSVFIIYYNGKVEMKKVYFAHDLDYKNIRVAVGGVGLRDTTNPEFKYDPASEGFKKDVNKITGKVEDQSGVTRLTNKTVIGYNKAENKIYLMVRPNIYHKHSYLYDLLKLVKDCEYDIALSLDGGGSTFMNNADEMVLFGDNRRINNIIGFGI